MQKDDEDCGIDGGEVETEERRNVPDPQLPHPDIVAAHNLDHTPYRSWCRWCVGGRGIGEQHKPRHSQHDIPVIGIDYFYLTGSGLQGVEDMGCSRGKSGLGTPDGLVGKGVTAKCSHR